MKTVTTGVLALFGVVYVGSSLARSDFDPLRRVGMACLGCAGLFGSLTVWTEAALPWGFLAVLCAVAGAWTGGEWLIRS